MPTPEVALLLTHSADHFTIDRVAAAVTRRGGRPIRFNTDTFPGTTTLGARLEAGGVARHTLRVGTDTLAAAEVHAVWARRISTPRLSEDLDPQHRDICVRETRAALDGFLDGLGGARWLDPLDRARAAENKLRQLRVAAAHGLRIPRTLVTNAADEVRDFHRELSGAVVVKMQVPASQSMGKASVFMHTSAVRAEDLEALDGLALSPMVFQERIDKARELRVIHVAGRFFVGAIDASSSARGQVDWRLARPDECPWREDELPAPVAAGLAALMRDLGLGYGAIDLIRTPAGEHVFLEVNPGGEWGMLERDLALPIGDAIAAALLAPETAP